MHRLHALYIFLILLVVCVFSGLTYLLIAPESRTVFILYSVYALTVLSFLLVLHWKYNYNLMKQWVEEVSAAMNEPAQDMIKAPQVMLEKIATLKQENVHYKEEAEKNANVKSAFLANVSHEIRTPMNGIMGMHEMLGATELNDQQRHYIDVSNASAGRLLKVIDSMLDFSKLEVDQLEFQQKQYDFEEDVLSLISVHQEILEEKCIKLEFNKIDTMPRWVQSDPLRVHQVMSNLLSNAVKFTNIGGRIIINIGVRKRSADEVVLYFSVEDNGIGFSQEEAASLFDSFSQIDVSSTRLFEGAGLGLSIGKKIAEKLGGTISVVSEKGKGSWFTFTFSCQPCERQQPGSHVSDRPQDSV